MTQSVHLLKLKTSSDPLAYTIRVCIIIPETARARPSLVPSLHSPVFYRTVYKANGAIKGWTGNEARYDLG